MNRVILAVHREDIRVICLAARQCPDPMRARKLVLVEHSREYPAKPILVYQSQDGALYPLISPIASPSAALSPNSNRLRSAPSCNAGSSSIARVKCFTASTFAQRRL